ncbi:MAG: glucokinase, partial [Candidatus Nanoarchaeia archaeon]
FLHKYLNILNTGMAKAWYKMGFVVCADIGGTNCSVSLMDTKKNKRLVLESRPTMEIKDFTRFLSDFLTKTGRRVEGAGIAIAGPVTGKEAKLTNGSLKVKIKELQRKAGIAKVILLNDLEATANSLNLLDRKSLYTLRRGKQKKAHNKAVVGVGTGLGAAIAHYNHSYNPIPTEYGHSEPSIDRHLFRHIEKELGRTPDYEELVSGRGLERIYKLIQKDYKVTKGLNAGRISKEKETNPCAKEAFRIFVKHLAGFSRNFCLSCLPLSGLYISGGIAANNYKAFSGFADELSNHPREEIKTLLKQIPVHIITDYYINHLGALYALKKEVL